MIREHYICRGRVQGCGFRYKASHAARALGLTGYVRNCDDGSVEMEVQGEGGKRMDSAAYLRGHPIFNGE